MSEKRKKKLESMAKELAKGIKTEKDLSDLSDQLLKMTVEAALGSEMEHHLGYAKHSRQGHGSGNSRNGHSRKRLKNRNGEIQIQTPRDRDGSFEPQLVHKGQTRLTAFDDQILGFYAKGMSTREIADAFQEVYGAEISPALVSQVTERVLDTIQSWQHRPLESLYPIMYLDGIVVKVRQDKRIVNKTIYVALGVDLEGRKECLGLWIYETEGAKTWLSVLTELRERGLKDILIVCADGLTGLPDAIEAVYPQSKIQLCIVHMVRHSMKYVSWKERKEVAAGLKRIYTSTTEEEAHSELEAFCAAWDDKYPVIGKSWHRHWQHLITLFDYPQDIRKAIYTTNAIESLNSVIRQAVRKRKVFPHDDAAFKVVYLAIERASRRWTKPIRNWKGALQRFMIEFPERLEGHI